MAQVPGHQATCAVLPYCAIQWWPPVPYWLDHLLLYHTMAHCSAIFSNPVECTLVHSVLLYFKSVFLCFDIPPILTSSLSAVLS